jgi:hypothetical protein
MIMFLFKEIRKKTTMCERGILISLERPLKKTDLDFKCTRFVTGRTCAWTGRRSRPIVCKPLCAHLTVVEMTLAL